MLCFAQPASVHIQYLNVFVRFVTKQHYYLSITSWQEATVWWYSLQLTMCNCCGLRTEEEVMEDKFVSWMIHFENLMKEFIWKADVIHVGVSIMALVSASRSPAASSHCTLPNVKAVAIACFFQNCKTSYWDMFELCACSLHVWGKLESDVMKISLPLITKKIEKQTQVRYIIYDNNTQRALGMAILISPLPLLGSCHLQ